MWVRLVRVSTVSNKKVVKALGIVCVDDHTVFNEKNLIDIDDGYVYSILSIKHLLVKSCQSYKKVDGEDVSDIHVSLELLITPC